MPSHVYVFTDTLDIYLDYHKLQKIQGKECLPAQFNTHQSSDESKAYIDAKTMNSLIKVILSPKTY